MSTCEGVEGPWGARRPLGASTRERQPGGTPASLQGDHVSVPGVPDMCVSVRGQGVPRRAGLKRPTSSVAVGRWGSGSMSAHVCGHTRVCVCAIMVRVCACALCVCTCGHEHCVCVCTCACMCVHATRSHMSAWECVRVCACVHTTHSCVFACKWLTCPPVYVWASPWCRLCISCQRAAVRAEERAACTRVPGARPHRGPAPHAWLALQWLPSASGLRKRPLIHRE